MHIRIDIYPDSLPFTPKNWATEMTELGERINQVILDGVISKKSYAIGQTTLLHLKDSGIILATIDIRRE